MGKMKQLLIDIEEIEHFSDDYPDDPEYLAVGDIKFIPCSDKLYFEDDDQELGYEWY